MVFIIYGNLQFVPGRYDDWQVAYDKLDEYVFANEQDTRTYYFGVPIEYKDKISETTHMLAFEVYGKREDLYETHFNSPAMKKFLPVIPSTMTTGLDLTHYTDVSGFLDKSGKLDECGIIFDTKILCHSAAAREYVLKKLQVVSKHAGGEEKGTYTFWVLKSLDHDDEVRIFERYESFEAMQAHQRSSIIVDFWMEAKDEIKSMDGRTYVPNHKATLKMPPSTQKVAIITGAASGMGEALATHLISKDWPVTCLDLQRGTGEALAASLGPNASFFEANVADYDSQARVFQAVFEKWGRVDALCANAGIVDKSSIYVLKYKGSDVTQRQEERSSRRASVAGIYPHETYPEYNGAKAAVINFARGVAPVLKLKENILINTVLPGIVPTKIIPQEMLDAVSEDCLTPIDTIVRAYDHFLADENQQTGEALECSVQSHFIVPKQEYVNGTFSARACTVWEPLYKMMHGENSELPDAIP
ncbi:hypothetical protein G7Y89_g3852 [Cudoniella acicularis]|uniref:ABM domain-containing protein n=1 Tax=Cudoniella acicularis TaxID=354080 RepID=A0A8H4RSQ6_9HELO|nr:hypothetical protein G7Y89_g3852 [Cudoniella acicularis]